MRPGRKTVERPMVYKYLAFEFDLLSPVYMMLLPAFFVWQVEMLGLHFEDSLLESFFQSVSPGTAMLCSFSFVLIIISLFKKQA